MQRRSASLDAVRIPSLASIGRFSDLFFFDTLRHVEARKNHSATSAEHVRDAEGRSARLLLTLNTSQCSQKKTRKKQASKSVQGQNTLHMGAAVSYCAV